MPLQGLPTVKISTDCPDGLEHVSRLKMRYYPINCGYVGPSTREVSSSYRCYLGNLGFFWRIFRDITPIAARQALGWEFRSFLALG
jgi:hypothetical protein